MAAPTFTVVSRREGGEFPPSSLVQTLFGLLVVDGGYGANDNPITAATFGLTYVHSISPAVLSTNESIIPLAPIYSATGLSTSVIAKASATLDDQDMAAGTYAVTVTGS